MRRGVKTLKERALIVSVFSIIDISGLDSAGANGVSSVSRWWQIRSENTLVLFFKYVFVQRNERWSCVGGVWKTCTSLWAERHVVTMHCCFSKMHTGRRGVWCKTRCKINNEKKNPAGFYCGCPSGDYQLLCFHLLTFADWVFADSPADRSFGRVFLKLTSYCIHHVAHCY